MKPTLLLPSNVLPTYGADTEDAPRVDFLELSRTLDNAPILYPPLGGGLTAILETKTASDLRQAWSAVRHRRSVSGYVSLSEKVGLPLALLLGEQSPVPHVLVAHHLTSERKGRLHARTGILHRFTRIVVLCREQERYLLNEAGIAPEKVRFIYDKVDTGFWRPEGGGVEQKPYLLSVGKERRDYSTLFAIARQLPEQAFVVAASSPWARGEIPYSSFPPNVRLPGWLSSRELRTLYSGAAAVIVPLEDETRYAAGVNAVLEAMAMAKPLIVTQTPGIADYVENDINARLVPPANADALAVAVRELLAVPEKAARLGANARAAVEAGRNLETYVSALAAIVCEAREAEHAR